MDQNEAGKGLARACFVFSILGWLAVSAAFIVYNLNYGTNEFSFLVQAASTMPFAIAAGIIFLISFILDLIYLFKVCRKKVALNRSGGWGLALSCLFLIPTGLILGKIFMPPLMHQKTLSGNDYIAIDAGNYHFVALKADGSILSWGDSAMVPPGNDYVAVAAGSMHNVALKSDGSIIIWGRPSDYNGQFNAPQGNDYIAIDAGDYHNLALKTDGSIVNWGYNYELRVMPFEGNFIAIAAGQHYNLAIKFDGSIVSWLQGSSKLLDVPQGNDFIAVSAGDGFSLAVRSDGSIVCWGGWEADDLGLVPKENDFVAVSAGNWHCLALRSDGSVVAWGDNDDGEGYSPKGQDFIAVEAGSGYSLALKSDGSIIGWGDIPL